MIAPKPWMLSMCMRAGGRRRGADERMRGCEDARMRERERARENEREGIGEEGQRTEGGRDADDQALAFDFVEEIHFIARRTLNQIHIRKGATDSHPGWAGGVEQPVTPD